MPAYSNPSTRETVPKYYFVQQIKVKVTVINVLQTNQMVPDDAFANKLTGKNVNTIS